MPEKKYKEREKITADHESRIKAILAEEENDILPAKQQNINTEIQQDTIQVKQETSNTESKQNIKIENQQDSKPSKKKKDKEPKEKVMYYVKPHLAKGLRMLACENDVFDYELANEALELLLIKYGKLPAKQ